MRFSRSIAPLLGLTTLTALGLAAMPAQAQTYTLTILGPLYSVGNAVNNS
jgi:hypothetical protein